MRQDIFWTAKTDSELLEYFENMAEDECDAFFAEYITLRDERVRALNRRFWRSGAGNVDDLNFEPGTLVDLWGWASRLVRREDLTDSERNHVRTMPEALLQSYRTRLTQDTHMLLNDIAYYFGEVVVRSIHGIHWAVCKTKLSRYIDRNQPVLAGFRAPGYELGVNPRRWLQVIASKAVDGKGNDSDILKAYERCYEAA